MIKKNKKQARLSHSRTITILLMINLLLVEKKWVSDENKLYSKILN